MCFWNIFRFVCECFLLCRLVTNAFGFKLLSRFESETCFVWDLVCVKFSAVRVIWDRISVYVWRCWTVGKCFLLFLLFWRCETTWQVSHVLFEMFLSVWSEKLVFTGQQTVIFLRLANSSFSSRFKIFTLFAKLKNEMNVQSKNALVLWTARRWFNKIFVKISFEQVALSTLTLTSYGNCSKNLWQT